eukprot:TRINITY_DN11866_c1_g11_i1.p1 TRINITY_DN11866_c1_g11~~TRINITY_DN11866_c1_g11_i1.p1  ORF type:complete len:1120 (+),score=308.76 TRINITY_DN11866_c1_g11_i1:214-3573(+)
MQKDSPHTSITRDETMFKQYVQIQRDANGLGLTLTGNAPTLVQSIVPDGAAARGGLQKGDALLEVNEEDVTNLNHHQVGTMLMDSDMLFLQVLRRGQPETRAVAKHNIAVTSFDEVDGGDSLRRERSMSTLESTLQPFANLRVLEQHPAHMATFVNYVMNSDTCKEALLFYLNVISFKLSPKAEDARVLFTDFLAPAAPMHVSSIPEPSLRKVETAISERKPDPIALVHVFSAAASLVEGSINDGLEQFRNHITVGLGDAVKFQVLQDMQSGEEVNVIETMLLPHIDAAHATDDPRSAIADEALRIFLARHAGPGGHAGDADAGYRDRSHSFKGRKSKRRTHFIRGHQFVVTTYKSPTYCAVCEKLIWGLYCQGWDCQNCGMHIHKDKDRFGFSKCHTLLTEECQGKPGGKSKRSFLGRNSRRKSRSKSAHGNNSNSNSSSHHDGYEAPTPEMARSISQGSVGSSLTSRSAPNSQHGSMRKHSDGHPDHGLGLELPFEDYPDEPAIWDDTVSDQGLLKSLNKQNKQEVKRQRNIYELVQTEKGYLRHLHIMQQVFRRTLVEEKFLSPNQIYDLFCNVDDLISCNSTLAHALDARQQETAGRPVERIGDVFKSMFSLVKLEAYAKFCANQKNAAQVYDRLLESNIHFNSTMARCESSPYISRLSLKDFLVKPFQRLTKYPLLLKNIVSNTTDERELADLQDCMKQTDQALKHVEEAIRRSEDRARLLEIESTMDTAGLNAEELQVLKGLSDSSFGLVYERDLQLKAHDKVFDVRAILLTHALVLCQKKDHQLVVKLPGRDNKNRSPIIVLNSTIVRPNAGNPKSMFIVHTDKRGPQMYELVTTNKKDTEKWRTLISKTVEDFRANFPDYEEQLQEAIAEQEALKKEQQQANTLEEDLNKILVEMQAHCDDNQRLLKDFDRKLHESGLGELAGKADEAKSRSSSGRRERRALRSRAMSGRPRQRSHSAAVPFNNDGDGSVSPRTTPSPQGRLSHRSVSLGVEEQEQPVRDELSPTPDDSRASSTNGLVHARELAVARVEIAQLQRQVARLKKQLFQSSGAVVSDPQLLDDEQDDDELDDVIEDSVAPMVSAAGAAAPKQSAKRPSLTIAPEDSEIARESAV